MKILKSNRKNFSFLGITFEQSMQKYPFNWKNLLVIFILCSSTVFNGLYLHYDAKTFNEYTICVYTTGTGMVSVISFSIVLWKMWPSFIMMNDIEIIFKKSESISIKFKCAFFASFVKIVYIRIKKSKVKRNV